MCLNPVKWLFLTVIIMFLANNPLVAQDYVLSMYDLNDDPAHGGFDQEMVYKDKLYCRLSTGLATGLYVYDGESTPQKISDVSFSNIPEFIPNRIVFQDKLYFSGAIDGQGHELLVYDEDNGLTVFKDIFPGESSSFPQGFTIVNDELYFYANADGVGFNIWKYDGINDPTLAIALKNPANIHQLAAFNGKLYFRDTAPGTTKNELWEYDGVNTPTAVTNNAATSSSFTTTYAFVFDDKLIFSFTAVFSARQLWIYDGVNPPMTLVQSFGGNIGNDPIRYQVYDGKLFFQARNLNQGTELWMFDGVNPVNIFQDIATGPDSSYPDDFVIYKDTLFFAAGNAEYGRELWKIYQDDPAELAFDANPGINSFDAANGITFKNKLYLQGKDDARGNEMWVYDGQAPPKLFNDYNRLNLGSNVNDFFKTEDQLYFQSSDNVSGVNSYLWRSEANERPVLIDTVANSNDFAVLGDQLLFFEGADIWKLNNEDEFTVAHSFMEVHSFNEERIIEFQNQLYFTSAEDEFGWELWTYDGNSIPTLVEDINQGPEDALPYNYFIQNDQLFFSAFHPNSGRELYQYDGVDVTLVELVSGAASSSPRHFINFNNQLHFLAAIDSFSLGLWKYDGITVPELLYDLLELTESNDIDEMIVHQDQLYFGWLGEPEGSSLWRYDGENEPELTWADSTLRNEAIFRQKGILFNDQLFFTAAHDTCGQELWVYDFENPPVLVQDINLGERSADPRDLIIFQDKLFFSANDQYHGREFWQLEDCSMTAVCCLASFYQYPDTSGQFDLLIMNNSLAENPSYTWDFGDGNISTEPFPTHTYTEAGTYRLCLTLEADNCTDEYCDLVTFADRNATGFSINVVGEDDPNSTRTPEKERFSLILSPNPTTDFLHINTNLFSPELLNIYSTTGQLKTQMKFSLTINTSHLPTGIYFVEVVGEERRIMEKFVKY